MLKMYTASGILTAGRETCKMQNTSCLIVGYGSDLGVYSTYVYQMPFTTVYMSVTAETWLQFLTVTFVNFSY